LQADRQADKADSKTVNSAPVAPESMARQGHPVKAAWRRYFYGFIIGVYFERITVIHSDRAPKSGPILYLGLHRNGAVDGFVYNQALHNPVFMISTQLQKNWFARLFFDGIAVTRTKDEGDHRENESALKQCLDHLRAGGALFVFPEGTSGLGPRHLPFKSGAIWLLLDYLETNGAAPLQVVPVGIHYEQPEAFRASVEVVIGERISTELPANASQIERLKILKKRMQMALEDIGINVPTPQYQAAIERVALAATLGTKRCYFNTLKALEKAIPTQMADELEEMEQVLKGANVWCYQGVPLFPIGSVLLCFGELILLLPLVVAAIILNLPAFLAGWYAGKKFPDGRNVISLWKILVGVPVFAIWSAGCVATLLFLGKFAFLAAYLGTTVIGLKFYYRFKKVVVAVHNALRQPSLRNRVLKFHQTVLKTLPDENA
jgi:1-acyl-sn-glycerol-3-phosphate acyltransferase